MDIPQILLAKYPGTYWHTESADYSGLVWECDAPKPTEAELEALWPTVEYEVAYEAVEKARQQAYQETADPIFFEYQRGDATEQDWLNAVQAVKDAHPYPEAP
jgi:hypothetical protein